MKRVTRSELSVLVSALAAASCNSTQPSNPSDSATGAPTVEVRPPAGGALSASSVDEPSSADQGDAALAARRASLRARPEWRGLAALWRELDAIAPLPGASPREPGRDVYAHAIDSGRAEVFSSRASEIVGQLERAKLLSREEAEFFGQALSTRIRNMRQGAMPLMIMHMMPPPYAMREFASVDRLEQRIDTLVELRDRGQLAASEYQLALEHVQRETVTLYVLYELGRGGHVMRPATIDKGDGETMLAQIGRQVAEARADAGDRHRHLTAIVTRAKTLVPAIRALVAELER